MSYKKFNKAYNGIFMCGLDIKPGEQMTFLNSLCRECAGENSFRWWQKSGWEENYKRNEG